MPLFKCSRCGAKENTALGSFWGTKPGTELCSECETGTWHGSFPKVDFEEYYRNRPEERNVHTIERRRQ